MWLLALCATAASPSAYRSPAFVTMTLDPGGWKWFGVAFAYQTALAWTMALVIHQGGRLLGLGG